MRIKSRRNSVLVLVAALVLSACADDEQRTPESSDVDGWCYPFSQIVIRPDRGRSDADARSLADQVYRLLKGGRGFPAAARRYSDDPSKVDGGFVGFTPPRGKTALWGALQALEPGSMSRPVRADDGYLILNRHTFAEGARLERELLMPVYGVLVPFEGMRAGEGRTKEQAFSEATRILKGVRGNVLDLNVEVDRFLPSEIKRRSSFMGSFSLSGPHPLVDPLRDLPIGRLADVFETDKGFGVAKRGAQLRCALRQILVQHTGSEKRSMEVMRTRVEALAIANRVISEVKQDRSNWNELVTRFSDSMETVGSGGWIGTLGNGDAPPQIEAHLMKLSPGDVSAEPLESPDGFHVFWRLQ